MKWIGFLTALCLFAGCSSNSGSSEQNPAGIDKSGSEESNTSVLPEDGTPSKEKKPADTSIKETPDKSRKGELLLPYIQKNTCPFEGCKYRKIWKTNANVNVYQAANQEELLFTLKKGSTFKALKGDVHILKPGKLVITESFRDFKKGEEIPVLSYQGEGVYDLWYKGKVFHKYVPELWSAVSAKAILESKPQTEWWVYIVTERGRFGWIRGDGVIDFE